MATRSTKKKATKRKPKQARATGARPGDVIERTYKGKTIKVTVTEDGYRCQGKDWPSLTALAKHVTGAVSISGPRFFGLVEPKTKGGAK